MSITLTGAQFKRYYEDPAWWPDGAFHDDNEIFVNGTKTDDLDVESMKDTDKVEIRGGIVCYDDGDDMDMVSHASEWLKAQSTAALMIEAPLDKLDAIKAAVIAAGGTVLEA
ncbi:hypothetical protein [Paucibacter soli]|uniref:hypothetical protein n=1 Tax=Paucibacter soli TaxID=3133433 RepID=UPI003097DEFC